MSLELDRNSPSTDHTSITHSNNITPSKSFKPTNPIFTQSAFNSASPSDFIYTPATLIGTGSFAQVFKATHKTTERIYALKIIDKSRVPSQEQMDQIKNEINILSNIYNQHIIKLLSHFEDNDSIYLLMPYLSQGQLYKEIQRRKVLDEATVAQYALDIIDAVQYLHTLDPLIIHRDIKTENILLDDNKHVVLTDFGTGTYMNKGDMRKTYCGSPEYLAPEIVKGMEYDERVDIWAIGVLIFEMATGTTPFKANTSSEVYDNITALRISWPYDISPLAKNLIGKILRLDPNDRLTLKQIKKHPFFSNADKQAKAQSHSYNSAKFIRSMNRKESLSLFHKKSIDESLHPILNQIRNELESSRSEISALKREIGQLTSTNQELLSLISTLTDESNSLQSRYSQLQIDKEAINAALNESEEQLRDKDMVITQLQRDFNSRREVFIEEKAALVSSLNQLRAEYNEHKDKYASLLNKKTNFLIEDFQLEYIGNKQHREKCEVKEQLITIETMFKEIKSELFDIINSNCKEIKAIHSFYKDNNEYIRQCYLNSFTAINELIYQMDSDVKKVIERTMTDVCEKVNEEMRTKVKWLSERNDALMKEKEEYGRKVLDIERVKEEKRELLMRNEVGLQQLKVYEVLTEQLQEKVCSMSSEILELRFNIQNMMEKEKDK